MLSYYLKVIKKILGLAKKVLLVIVVFASIITLFAYFINKDKQKLVPGITHIDGTGRLQTVSKTTNEKYHKLISEFKRLTGIPMVVNTSFNIKGEPIIESPVNAIKCFLGNGLDYLVMSDFVIKK